MTDYGREVRFGYFLVPNVADLWVPERSVVGAELRIRRRGDWATMIGE